MSEENVEAARRMIDDWNRGDIDEWAQGLREDVVWVPLTENPQTEPARGVDDVRQFVSDWVAPWDQYRIDGKGVEFCWFSNEADALRAAGIEDTPSG